MKLLLYLLGSLLLVGAAAAMALLPHLATSLWLFIVLGAVFSGLIAGGWLVLSASAGDWPRLRAGPVLTFAGLAGVGFGLWEGQWQEFGWSALVVLVGIPLWLAVRRSRRPGGGRGPDAVRGPLSRREQA